MAANTSTESIHKDVVRSGMRAETGLPDTFFEADYGDDAQKWVELHAALLEGYLEEGGDTLADRMLRERTSFMYTWLRKYEAETPTLVGNREYQAMFKVLVAMLESIRQQQDREFAIEEARAEVMASVASVLEDALSGLSTQDKQNTMQKMAKMLGELE